MEVATANGPKRPWLILDVRQAMHIGLHVTSKETDSCWIVFDCPVCERKAVNAPARDFRQMVLVFYVLPIFYHRPTFVDCPCGVKFSARLKASQFAGLDAQFAGRCLSVRVPPVLKTLVLGGVIAWLLPGIGTIWMGIAYWWARRYSGWIRSLALVLFLLSLIPTGALVVEELSSKARAHKPNKAPATVFTKQG